MTGSEHPHRPIRRKQSGWTLIELLVVLAIIAILAAASIPVARMFGRNDLRNGARTLSTMLRAARVYAMTYNVETAVVYSLDYPFSKSANGAEDFSPIEDSVLRDPVVGSDLMPLAVRTIRAAAIMYRLPNELNAVPVYPPGVEKGDPAYKSNFFDSAQAVNATNSGTFVMAPVNGEFVSFPQGYSLLLTEPRGEFDKPADSPEGAFGNLVYKVDYGLRDYDPVTRFYLLDYNRQMEVWEKRAPSDSNWKPSLEKIGMKPVHAYPLSMENERIGSTSEFQIVFDPSLIRPLLAHVFNPDGSMNTRHQDREKYRLLFAPDPSTLPEDRLISMDDGYVAQGIIVEINRATGRVKLGT